MKNRSPIAVVLLGIITFGIYSLYWLIDTAAEMRRRGADIPTSWLIIVPIANIWWLWKYSEGAEHVTGGKSSAVMSFLLLWLLGYIGAAIIQLSFNEVGAEHAPGQTAPTAPLPLTPATPAPATVAAPPAAGTTPKPPP